MKIGDGFSREGDDGGGGRQGRSRMIDYRRESGVSTNAPFGRVRDIATVKPHN